MNDTMRNRFGALRELAGIRNFGACSALIDSLTDDQLIQGQNYFFNIRQHSAMVARDLLSEERIRRCEKALSDALHDSGDLRYRDELIGG